ncbi:melatonin receptor type 1A-like [Tubulanus polymorphus]|uniref:melatonin receptor type 1A-like n=1 Tax=Tubulanus polymorphus TaxID=672921 RepID=UPI003DA61C4B
MPSLFYGSHLSVITREVNQVYNSSSLTKQLKVQSLILLKPPNTGNNHNEYHHIHPVDGSTVTIVDAYKAMKIFVISCYIFFGVAGNLLIIIAVARKKKLQVTTSVFIVNVAISDMVVAAVVMPTILVNLLTDGRMVGYDECVFFAFVLLTSCGVSLISLSLIAFNRYVNVCHHAYYKRVFENRFVVVMVAAVWSFSFSIVAIGSFTPLAKFSYDPRLYTCTYINRESRVYTLLLMTVGIVLPCVLTSFGYIKIFRKIRDSQNNMMAHASATHNNKEKKAIFAMFSAFAAFAICWFPYGTIAIVDAFTKGISDEAHLIVAWLAFGNCSLNWLIYGGLNSNFRQGYKKIFVTCRSRNKRAIADSTTTQTNGNLHRAKRDTRTSVVNLPQRQMISASSTVPTLSETS